MSWNPDREPIEYLERRLRYYKRLHRWSIRHAKEIPSQAELGYYGGKRGFKEACARMQKRYELRINQFSEAIIKLKK